MLRFDQSILVDEKWLMGAVIMVILYIHYLYSIYVYPIYSLFLGIKLNAFSIKNKHPNARCNGMNNHLPAILNINNYRLL